ncbi:MAG: Lrp/AsnC ligand binding domain-containing protein [Planctomycetota bacterium]
MEKVLGYMFLQIAARKVADAVASANKLEGVRAAHAVTGRHDVIVQLEAEDFATLANEVLPRLRAIEGVQSSETAIVIEEPREEL